MPLKHITTFQLFGLKVIDIYWSAGRSEIFNIYQAELEKLLFWLQKKSLYVLPLQSIHIFRQQTPKPRL